VPGEGGPVRFAAFQEGVTSLNRLGRAIGQTGGLTGEQLLADHAVIGGIHGVLEHADSGWTLAEDHATPLHSGGFELGVRDNAVDYTQLIGTLGIVGLGEEENFPGELLTNLLGQVGTTVPGIEGTNVGVGLLEPCVLGTGDAEVSDYVQRVATASRPSWNQRDDDLGHESDDSLNLQDVEPARSRWIHARRALVIGVFVAILAAHPLVSAAGKRPAAILR
jgi:hypothetical protein